MLEASASASSLVLRSARSMPKSNSPTRVPANSTISPLARSMDASNTGSEVTRKVQTVSPTATLVVPV